MTNQSVPRHKPENPFKYTSLQLAQRSKALKDMERDYPNLPYAWLELAYDFVANEDENKINDIINSGAWETRPLSAEEKQDLIHSKLEEMNE